MRLSKIHAAKVLARASLVILLLCAANAFAQAQYNLSYNWSAGEKNEYSVYVLGYMQNGQSTKQDIRISYTDQWEVAAQDTATGYFRITETAKNFKGESTNLESFGVLSGNEEVGRIVDDSGRVAKVLQKPEKSRFQQLILVLPAIPMGIGGKWKLESKMRIPLLEREADTDLTLIYTLEDINRNYKGRRQDCARIRVDAKYKWEAQDQSSGVTGAYQGRIFFDLQKNRIVDTQITENRKEWINSENRVKTTSLQITSIGH